MDKGLRYVGAITVLAVLAGCGNGRDATPAAAMQPLQLCFTCHSAANENRPTGPNLHGVFGRPAASGDGYFYSQALRQSGIVWDEATLDAYLANPTARVPGTFMIIRVPDAKRRAAIIEQLKRWQPDS